ncbi:hypothetical protein [Candidatus Uabimicrobium amorphum]|nr:hypothetical protein [Candidatus Uabimicrobium amorphum]
MKKGCILLIFLFASWSIMAEVITLIDGNADLVEIAGPQNFSQNQTQSDDQIFVFQEREDFVLGQDLNVDTTATGTFNSANEPGVIAAGTEVDVFLIHMDPFVALTHNNAGSIVFSNPIIGLITTAASLNNTDAVIGDPASIYDAPAPGFRGIFDGGGINDTLTVSADRFVLDLDTLGTANGNNAEQIRVITVANSVPEPSMYFLLVCLSLLFYRKLRNAKTPFCTAVRK